ncbi:hypothetical protein CSB45_00335 [candidate division KSB3 bacterium]|uniref:Sulfatase-modifying factor enzyme-like domain-containing protein n=1 Tax=candidate division KSB3 bacterium TaxID=2044937 RepID=A0A2G6EE59_9BACT|nr:MAG: hypothetical protein CSB45_00335 [candidate division KSB3 bacterium]
MHATDQTVFITLLHVGAHKEAVASVLSKIQGLKDSPDRLIAGVPCRISGKVPLPLAEKVKMYLEKVGATVSLDDEKRSEAGFSAPQLDKDELPVFDGSDDFEWSSEQAEAVPDEALITGRSRPAGPIETDVMSFEQISEDSSGSDTERREAGAAYQAEDDVHGTQARSGFVSFASSPDQAALSDTKRLNTSRGLKKVLPRKTLKRRSRKPSRSWLGIAVPVVLALVLFAGLAVGLWFYRSGAFPFPRLSGGHRFRSSDTGVLTVENPDAAELKLYHVIGTRVIEQIPFDGKPVSLQRGDYYIEAVNGRDRTGFPVYIAGRGSRTVLPVSVSAPDSPLPGLVYIPGGWFRMGNKKTATPYVGFSDESPAVDVYVSGFFLSQYEVTNEEYRKFVDDGGYDEERYWQRLIEDWPSLTQRAPAYEQAFGRDGWHSVSQYIRLAFIDTDDRPGPRLWQFDEPPYDDGHDSRPIVGISLYEADAYCRWKTQQSGILHRLPTEAEWEKAARGKEGYLFSYGNEYDGSLANTESQTPKKVGSYPPNSYGLYDMTGNVWEWVSDQYDAERYQSWRDKGPFAVRDPRAFDADNAYDRVIIKGGSFRSVNRMNARTCVRYAIFPNDWHTNIGFRYVVAP